MSVTAHSTKMLGAEVAFATERSSRYAMAWEVGRTRGEVPGKHVEPSPLLHASGAPFRPPLSKCS